MSDREQDDVTVELAIAVIRERLEVMTANDRLSLLSRIVEDYCRECGGAEGFRCLCMRDD